MDFPILIHWQGPDLVLGVFGVIFYKQFYYQFLARLYKVQVELL